MRHERRATKLCAILETRRGLTASAWEPMPDRVFERASEVQALLTAEGLHRGASAVDLLVPATAELRSVGLNNAHS
jgi:hypothetical protein